MNSDRSSETVPQVNEEARDVKPSTEASHAAGPPATAQKKTAFLDQLPPWITTNLRSAKSRKMLLRCWLGSWCAFVLIIPDKSLATLGNTAFFTLLVSMLLPANMPLQIFIVAVTLLVFGITLGWALSCAGMEAALKVRNQTVLKSTLQKTQESAAGLANPDAEFKVAIFNGDFLDPASNAIFGVFLGCGVFMFSLMRAYAPKLTFASIFGMIAMDIFCSYGPLFPFAQYTILNSLLTSVACYIAIALVLTVFVFPESMNHSYMNAAADLLEKFKTIIAVQDEVLQADPHDVLPGKPLAGKIKGLRAGSLAQIQQLLASKQFLGVEFSWGRWNGEDVAEIMSPLMVVALRLASLNGFAQLMSSLLALSEEPASDTESVADSQITATGDSYLFRQFRECNAIVEQEHRVRLVDILPNIREATSEVRAAAHEVLSNIKSLVVSVNRHRWFCSSKEQDALLIELDKSLTVLKDAMEAFKNDRRFVLLQPFQPLLEHHDAGKIRNMPLRSLYLAFAFSSNLTTVCHAIQTLAETVTAIASKRKTPRLWGPTSFRHMWQVLRSARGSGQDAVGEDDTPEEPEDAEEIRACKRDPDSRPPQNFLQRLANTIHKGYKWSRTPEALFAFRMVILTIALWIPQVAKASAGFVYKERGIWVLIMAQTTMNVYASDQVFNYVVRIIGTLVGALLGMACWYIGAGSGTGNPYGIAASAAVFILPIIFLRLFAPPQWLIGVIMTGATFTLVLGYSWIDGNLSGLTQNIGIGWEVTWKRWVTTMIGCAASFIVMMLPPKSGRKAVRIRNANVLSGISYLYSHLTSIWLSADDPLQLSCGKFTPASRGWPEDLRAKFVVLSEQIQDLRMRTEMSKWEGNIRGAWPYEDYSRMVELQSEMLNSLVLTASALVNMDPAMRKSTLPHTYILNPYFIGDVASTFYSVASSLRTGEPLHEAQLRNLSDRLHYHGMYSYNTSPAGPTRPFEQHQSKIRHELHDHEYMSYATAVVGMLQLTNHLTELRKLAADLVGEVPLEGYAAWREQYGKHEC
ncbi:uncharacterized protein BXZ73DRAFT_52330 [Epithele typhae]|uniref:uncharacterized protein n=1 Tax=Epithele typhae TaxID=378194 RepID=UPI00200743C1|nr:uncharacterized protein BXZ73DRAFT_52330 [Epithele typhae]KAH9919972.1 hypothetical protein BXZ73DRAFT_52330 [Epithele typhae]